MELKGKKAGIGQAFLYTFFKNWDIMEKFIVKM